MLLMRMPEYTAQVIRCAITSWASASVEPRDPPRQAHEDLLRQAKDWVLDGVELIQVREKHLGGADLFTLAEALLRLTAGSGTRVLINGRTDVAAAAGAHGVHLTAATGEMRPAQVRAVFAAAGRARPVVSVSCHTVEEIRQASGQADGQEHGDAADFILFGPVFEKRIGMERLQAGVGMAALREAVASAATGPAAIPVLALGGITLEHLDEVLATGAAGVAGIRLFA